MDRTGLMRPYAPALHSFMTVVSSSWQSYLDTGKRLSHHVSCWPFSGFYLTARFEQVRVWADLLDQLHLRGDERIPGHGMCLCGPAHGRSTFDHRSGGGCGTCGEVSISPAIPGAISRNIIAEGVADRVEIAHGT